MKIVSTIICTFFFVVKFLNFVAWVREKTHRAGICVWCVQGLKFYNPETTWPFSNKSPSTVDWRPQCINFQTIGFGIKCPSSTAMCTELQVSYCLSWTLLHWGLTRGHSVVSQWWHLKFCAVYCSQFSRNTDAYCLRLWSFFRLKMWDLRVINVCSTIKVILFFFQ